VADLNLRVLTEGDTRGLDKTARELDGLADKTDRAKESTKGLGDETERTGKKTEEFGRKSKRTSQDVVDLDKRIVELKTSLKGLNEEYERSGKLDRRKFGSDSRELSSLQRLKKEITGLGDETSRWAKLIDSVVEAIPGLSGLGKLIGNPAAAAVAAPAVVGGLITAGGMAGGAITAGAGATIAGAGVAGAAMQSQAVRDEWAKTTAGIKQQFLDATTSFEGPTLDAIRRVGGAIRAIDMKTIFGDAVKFVRPIAEGVASAVASFGRGVQELVSKGEPAILALRDVIIDVGRGTEDAMKDVAGGAEGGATALRDLGQGLYVVIAGTGKFIGWMEDAYGALKRFEGAAAEYHPFIGWMTDGPKVIARTLDFATDSAKGLTGALTDMSSQARIANDRFSELFGTMMDVDQANLAVKLGLAGLRDAMKDDGVTRDEMAQKVLRQIQLLQDQRNAQLATGDGSQAATDKINGNYRAQLEQLKKMFPWLDGLISKYEDLAKPLTKHITVVIDQVGSVSKEGVISGGDQRTRTGAAYASGTRSAQAGWALVGEQGPELVRMPQGAEVFTADQTSRMLSGASGGASSASGGGRTITIAFAGNTDTAFATAFMQLIREGLITIS
jgi:phage-related tail protein